MPRYVAFLRGINLGRRRLPMSRLKGLFEDLEFENVATFIASGNVIFSSKSRSIGKLESRVAAHLETSLGYAVDTFVREAEEVAAIARTRVFADEGKAGVTIYVGFLHRELPEAVARRLEAVRTRTDAFRVVECEFYWLCRVKMTESTVWAFPEIKALHLPSFTLRNMTSVRKLVARHLA